MNKNTIVRLNKTSSYTVMCNVGLHDPKLSWKAKGLLAYLLSLPNDWKIYAKELSNHSKDGRDATNAALNELIRNGYIIREKLRDDKGLIQGYVYQVFEIPVLDSSESQKTDSEKPDLPVNPCNEPSSSTNGFSVSGLSVYGKPVTTKYLPNKKLNEDAEEASQPAINLFKEANINISPLQEKTVKKLVEQYSLDFVLKAIQVTSDKAKVFNMDYLKKVLKSYSDNGFKTLTDIEDSENIDKLKKDAANTRRKKQLEAPATKKAPKAQKGSFSNCEQRTYEETDYDQLEKYRL